MYLNEYKNKTPILKKIIYALLIIFTIFVILNIVAFVKNIKDRKSNIENVW